MGIHFFYPVKLSSMIEFNNCSDRELASSLCAVLGKEPVFFENDYCMYLNQYISYTVSCAFVVKEKFSISTGRMMEILSDVFPQHSLFGMVDSIGLDLLSSGNTSNNVKRIRNVLDYARDRYKQLLSEGCPGGTGEFIRFINNYETLSDCDVSEDYIKTLIVSALLNEAVNVSEDCETDLTSVLADTIGLNMPMSDFFRQFGYETVKKSLIEINEELSSDAFKPASADAFNKYFL